MTAPAGIAVDMRAIVTADCTLEPQVAGHAGEMFTVLADPAIYQYENEPPPSVHTGAG